MKPQDYQDYIYTITSKLMEKKLGFIFEILAAVFMIVLFSGIWCRVNGWLHLEVSRQFDIRIEI
jgi:hypothetical protein